MAVVLGSMLVRAQAGEAAIAEIPFVFREGLLWVDVNVSPAERPLHFLLDTGAEVNVVNLATARSIGLKPGREVAVRGVHSRLTGYWLQKLTMQAGAVRLPGDCLALDLEKLSRSCERPVDGLLGADFFRGRIVQIDFAAQKIRLLKSPVPAPAADSEEVLPLQMRQGGMHVSVRVNGRKPQWVRLDTGCATPFQWVTSSVVNNPGAERIAIGLAELSIPQTTTTVRLGRQMFAEVPTGLHASPIFGGEAGLLGNGLLCRFSTITIDAKNGRLILGTRLAE